MMRATLQALLLCASIGAGCARKTPGTTTTPAAAGARAYLQALEANDPRAAYALLSDSVRESMSFEQFELRWRQSQKERRHQAEALASALKVDPDLGERAVVTYPDGRTIGLGREAGRWRLEAGLVSLTHAGSPRDALTIFAEALSSRSYEGVLRILTSRRREGISRQVNAFIASLGDHLENKISFVGKQRAEIQWTDGDTRYKIVFMKEGDEWRIDDIHTSSASPKSPEQKADE